MAYEVYNYETGRAVTKPSRLKRTAEQTARDVNEQRIRRGDPSLYLVRKTERKK